MTSMQSNNTSVRKFSAVAHPPPREPLGVVAKLEAILEDFLEGDLRAKLKKQQKSLVAMDPVMRNTYVKVLEGYLGNENPVLNQVIERYRHKIPGREANEVVRFSVLEACIPALPNTNSGKDRLLSVELANKPAQSTAR